MNIIDLPFILQSFARFKSNLFTDQDKFYTLITLAKENIYFLMCISKYV